MCGITGIWNLNGRPVAHNEIENFNNTITHRGPDGSGSYVDDTVGLAFGHRRLSILDLSEAGKQPMKYKNGNLIITYNGEIYNYIEIRETLKKAGHTFSTRTDTEVILAAYQEWGEDCLLKFNGMWAFAIWDEKNKKLFASRDRFGVKPFYYVFIPEKLFAFSSETVSFKSLAGFEKKVNAYNVSLNLRNSFYLEGIGETIYDHVLKLKPGHNLTIDNNKSPVIKQWWITSDHIVTVPDSYNAQVELYKELFLDSCKLRLRSDVPIGTALSGGLDSSSIYSTIKTIANQQTFDLPNLPDTWQTAFVASFPGTSMDEKIYADEVIKFSGGVARYIFPEESDIVNAIYNQTKAEDFIYLSPPVVHGIYREMRNNGVSVSLDGHGVDEMLFGYSEMVSEWASLEKDESLSVEMQNLWADMQGLPYIEARKRFANRFASKRTVLQTAYDSFLPEKIKTIYRRKQHERQKESFYIRQFTDFKKGWDSTTFTNRKAEFVIPYKRFHIDFLPTLLRNWDRASMHHGVEIRMPFMDWRLVTYVFSLPGDSKVKNGFTKRILRDAMKGQLPESIRLRKNKIGINAPMIEWFNGPMSTFLKDVVNSKTFLSSEIWNGPLLRSKVEKHCVEKSWDQSSCNAVWPFINAWILEN
jgi:asparagine synthase (glutamine-hydrolysing)